MLRSSKVVQISSRVATVGERSRKNMPKLLYARTPQDTLEEQKVRKLANSRHAPADWIVRARMIVLSWSALRTRAIAAQLGCHPQRRCENVSTAEGAERIDGLGDRPGAGRKPRLTEAQRCSWIISLVATDPPGRLIRGAGGELEARDEEKEAHWTLDALTATARAHGIIVGRSQVRRILKAEGVRWRNVHPWAESHDPEFVPKGRSSSRSTPARPRTHRPSA